MSGNLRINFMEWESTPLGGGGGGTEAKKNFIHNTRVLVMYVNEVVIIYSERYSELTRSKIG